jgi:hypothetical protein
MSRSAFRSRAAVSSSKEAAAAAAAVAKLAHRVHAMTGEDLATWLDTPDGELWALNTCTAMDQLLRKVHSRRPKPTPEPVVLPGDVLAGEVGEVE